MATQMSPEMQVKELEARVQTLQRAIFYLIWKRTGFGEHCVHCNHPCPGHEPKCNAAQVEQLVRVTPAS